jgi:hypothetical protein
VEVKVVLALKACVGKDGAIAKEICVMEELQPTSGANHQATLENSVCLKHPILAGCSSMELHSIDQIWQHSCAGLGANQENVELCPGC